MLRVSLAHCQTKSACGPQPPVQVRERSLHRLADGGVREAVSLPHDDNAAGREGCAQGAGGSGGTSGLRGVGGPRHASLDAVPGEGDPDVFHEGDPRQNSTNSRGQESETLELLFRGRLVAWCIFSPQVFHAPSSPPEHTMPCILCSVLSFISV